MALDDIAEIEDEALAETGNIILNSFVATMANVFVTRLEHVAAERMRGEGRHLLEAALREPRISSCSSTSISRSARSRSADTSRW